MRSHTAPESHTPRSSLSTRKFSPGPLLHLLALWSFAVAQPIYDLLGKNAEFFVAHRTGPDVILAFVLILSFALPGLPLFFLAALRMAAPRTAKLFQLALMGLLAALITLPILAANAKGWPAIAAALLAGMALPLAYSRIGLLRSFLTLLTPAIVLFPALFLFLTPISKLVLPAPVKTNDAQTVANAVPIILVVFDELNVSGLMDQERNIDSVRYPNLAQLSNDGIWYRRATSPHAYTKRSLPAILTGRRYREERPLRLPTAADYPENLFTWLSSGYHLNVSEPMTSLCPAELCDSNVVTFSAAMFASDISIVYLHRLLPERYRAAYLPPLTDAWKSFRRSPTTAASRKGFWGSVRGSRSEEWLAFVRRIGANPLRSLNFIHILLPHTPYQYLPSGYVYGSQPTLGFLPDNKTWSDETRLIQYEYHRYLLQLGFVDSMVGELIRHLKAENLYDESLIIITADHGAAFRPGFTKRFLNHGAEETAPDLLHVPLILKLPYQQQRQTSDRLVSGLDIVPTVAEVLGVQLPWPTDGLSMLADHFPEERTFQLEGEGPTRRFDGRLLTSLPLLDWQMRLFGSGEALAHLRQRGPYPNLIGQQLHLLQTRQAAGELRLQSKEVGLFDHIDFDSGFVPVSMTGVVLRAAEHAGDADISLAIAVNGRIEATLSTVTWGGSSHFFAAILPEAALRPGRNTIEVFAIKGPETSPSLTPILLESVALEETSEGESVVSYSDGRKVPFEPDTVQGWLDLQRRDSFVRLEGWAADLVRYEPVREVVVFVGERPVLFGKPSHERKDLVKHFGKESIRYSGFVLELPAHLLTSESNEIRVIGLSHHGVAGQLKFTKKGKRKLQKMQSERRGSG